MKITHLRVSASRGFNHPYEQFANFRFEIHQEAQLEDGEDPREQLLILQQQTETAAEVHKKRILNDIQRHRLIEQGERELNQLKARQKQSDETPAEIAKVQETLARLREVPFILAPVSLHPGHPEHPETDPFRTRDF